MSDESPMRLWVVDDSERHIVAAKDPDDAIRCVAEAFEQTVEKYQSECGPAIVTLHDMTKPCVVRMDSESDAKAMPPGGVLRITLEYPYKSWRDLPRGLLSSTVY